VIINRVIEANESSDVAALCIGVLSIPRITEVDAIVVPPGMGETWRVSSAISLWEADVTCAKHLLIAGANTNTEDGPPLTVESLRVPPYNLRREIGVEVKLYDENTVTQAQWVAERMGALRLESFMLCVSSYHLVRWFLTFLKVQERIGERFVIIPEPTPSSMNRVIPQSGATPWESVAGEVKRIATYQEKGDVATLSELQAYLDWLWARLPINTV